MEYGGHWNCICGGGNWHRYPIRKKPIKLFGVHWIIAGIRNTVSSDIISDDRRMGCAPC